MTRICEYCNGDNNAASPCPHQPAYYPFNLKKCYSKCFNQKNLLSDEQMRQFVADGFIAIKSGLTDEQNEILRREVAAMLESDGVLQQDKNPGNNIMPDIPELAQVFDDPAVYGALSSLLGPAYSVHSHRHVHYSLHDQYWHRDSYFGYQTIRRHRPHYLLGMYYCSDVTENSGPTIVVPGTHYISSRFGDAQSAGGRTFINPQIEVMPDEWNPRPQKCVVPAGTFLLMHHDLWHRGTRNLTDKIRYMFKFTLCRNETRNFAGPTWNFKSADPKELADNPIHLDTWNWLLGQDDQSSADDNDNNLLQLLPHWQIAPCLRPHHQSLDPFHTKVAYQLGHTRNPIAMHILCGALYNPDLQISRNAMFGLVSAGSAMFPYLLLYLNRELYPDNQGQNISAETNPFLMPDDAMDRMLAFACVAIGQVGIDIGNHSKIAVKIIWCLMELVKHDPSAYVRREALLALGNIVIVRLNANLKKESYPEIQDGINEAEVSEVFGGGVDLAELTDQQIVPKVTKMLLHQVSQEDNAEIRMAASEALLRLYVNMEAAKSELFKSGTDFARKLERELAYISSNDPNRYVRGYAFDLLTRMQSRKEKWPEAWYREHQLLRRCDITNCESQF
jgi:hypothetical protein